MTWTGALDIERAQANVTSDAFGDWYKDPWGWPEIAWAAKNQVGVVEARLNGQGTMRCVKVDVPKENYVTRPALILGGLDRLVYQALVDQLSKKLIGDMSSFAYGWRLSRKSPESGNYLNDSNEWKRYRERLVAFAKHFPNGLTTDVSVVLRINIDRYADGRPPHCAKIKQSNRAIGRLAPRLVADQRTNWSTAA